VKTRAPANWAGTGFRVWMKTKSAGVSRLTEPNRNWTGTDCSENQFLTGGFSRRHFSPAEVHTFSSFPATFSAACLG
jgi:hypothetical protein